MLHLIRFVAAVVACLFAVGAGYGQPELAPGMSRDDVMRRFGEHVIHASPEPLMIRIEYLGHPASVFLWFSRETVTTVAVSFDVPPRASARALYHDIRGRLQQLVGERQEHAPLGGLEDIGRSAGPQPGEMQPRKRTRFTATVNGLRYALALDGEAATGSGPRPSVWLEVGYTGADQSGT